MVNPLLLWFLPLALVPVLLHLITLHRLNIVELATFRFLMESYVQQRRRTRLLELLVLLLRFAFILLIIFAVSRPVVRKMGFLAGGRGGRDVAIVLDASPSMSLLSGGTTSMERARAAAETVIKALGPEDYVRVIRAGGEPQVLGEGFAARPEAILEHMDDLETSAAGADLAAALEEVFASKAHGGRLVCLVTDGLKKTWGPLAGHPVLKNFDDDTGVAVINVGPAEAVRNAAVVGNPPAAGRAIVGLPVLLDAVVVNSSPNSPVDTVLSVLLDDELVTRVNISLQPGEQVTRRLSVIPEHAGVIRGRFQLPADAFPDDDEFLFSINVEEKLDVLVVTGSAGGLSAEKPGLYARAALSAPRQASGAFGDDARRLSEALDIRTLEPGKLTRALLEGADSVILADVPVTASSGPLLRSYLEGGGGVLVLPGPNVDPALYGQHLFQGAAAAVGLGQPVGDVEDEAGFLPVTGISLSHPVLSAFADDEVEYFSTVRLYRRFPLQFAGGAEAGARSSVLMRLPDRSPLLVETGFGDGTLMVAGFAGAPNWSNLPLKPEFVPLLLRAVTYLQRPADVMAPGAVPPGQPAAISLSGTWKGAEVQATDPDGKRHHVELHRSSNRLVGAMLETHARGYYSFEVFPRTSGAPERVEAAFAVNLAGQQGDFAPAGEAEIRSFFAGSPKMQYLTGSPEKPIGSGEVAGRGEIWRILIWVTFLVIGVEFFLTTLRPQDEQGRGMVARGAARLRDGSEQIRRTLTPVPRTGTGGSGGMRE